MVFFNLIYQTHTRDHKRILLLGLGLYTAVMTILYSGLLPVGILDSNIIGLIKNYGWILILIDYLVLHLLHYFQTGSILRGSTPAIDENRPKYVAWKEPHSYQEDEFYRGHDDPTEYPLGTRCEDDVPEVPVEMPEVSSRMPEVSAEMPEVPAGMPEVPQQKGGGPTVKNEIPFDPEYTINDEYNEVQADNSIESDYFENLDEPKIVDNYAMNHIQRPDDLSSDSISE